VAGTALAALALVVTAHAARAERLTTNSQLLSRAVHGALDSLLAGVPLRPTDAVVILPSGSERQEWALENEIAGMLQRRVGRLAFHGALQDSAGGAEPAAPADGAVEAEADSTDSSAEAAPQPAAASGRSRADHRPLDPNANLLEYRVAALGVSYTDLHKSRLFGSGEVDRLASVSLGLRLLAPDGRLLWSAHARGQAQDRVPEARLAEVEDRLYLVPTPVLPNRSLKRLLEPAIVVGLVSGLVFLFYTNRN
jgi:hypothetical protein